MKRNDLIAGVWIFLSSVFLISAIVLCACNDITNASLFGEVAAAFAGVGTVFVLIKFDYVDQQTNQNNESLNEILESSQSCDSNIVFDNKTEVQEEIVTD
ncbi:MAG: hypothetical protein Q8876_03555 [Bacillota bacterium]|nr:hypothetical protein [Bacillota bacterium]